MVGKRIHFMGVGGAGCSAAFAIAKHVGFQVSGCDKEKGSPYLDKTLSKFVLTGHSPEHINGIDLLVYSPAIPSFDQNNEELSAAQKRGIKAVAWDEFVADELVKNKFVIAIAGTHGKGTVTAMVGVILEKAGLDPNCLIGAVVDDWGRNWRLGDSKYFVIEADEYSEKLLRFKPKIAAITNIEFDHPEYFKDFGKMKKVFEKFVTNLDKDSSLVIGPGVNLISPKGRTINVVNPVSFNLKMVGRFNKMNAAIATAAAKVVGIGEEQSRKTLEKFNGLGRRFEFVGEEKGVLVFDDYAHHPTAISETLKAAREKFPTKKIWLVFQPHLFSRTKALFDDFVDSFSNYLVNQVLITDIFGSREKDTGEVSSVDLVKAIGENAKYIPTLEEAATYIVKEVSVGDVVITMGAGDIYKLPDRLLEKLQGKG
ncbi:MAG: cyanophycin synthetase [Candidatus Woykebacteria bacterium]